MQWSFDEMDANEELFDPDEYKDMRPAQKYFDSPLINIFNMCRRETDHDRPVRIATIREFSYLSPYDDETTESIIMAMDDKLLSLRADRLRQQNAKVQH